MKKILELWKEYNIVSLELTTAMNSTTNVVGEFSEMLVAKYYNAKKMLASNKGADLETVEGERIQVKSRKLDKIKSTALGIIREWNFDFLVVILVDATGGILKAIQIGADDARELSKYNDYQKGHILITNKKLLNHPNVKDITEDIRLLMKG